MSPATPEPCRALADRIAASQEFRRAKRLRAFLSYVVDRHLGGHPEELTETQIGHRVFNRPLDYNSGDDSIVRTEARNLRLRLERYFSGEGQDEPIILEIPRGGYVPVFRRREVAPPPATPISRRRWLLMAAPAAGVAGLAAARLVPVRANNRAYLMVTHPGKVTLESSDPRLTLAFQRAKERALACVYSGDPIGDWYASSPKADAFCMRDLSHESLGAAVLGLSRHSANMLRRFAQSVSTSRKWCGYWMISKDGFPSSQSYFSDADFGYCLPAGFDLVRACYRQFLWTGDRAYLDADFTSFYEHTVLNFVHAWDRDGILRSDPERKRISPSYQQHSPYRTGADLVAAQYAAYRAYAEIQKFKGAPGSLSSRRAADFRALADALRRQFNDDWWNPATNRFHSGILNDGTFDPNYADQSNVYGLWFGIPDPGPKTEASLDAMEHSRPKFDSNYSYYPEVLYHYGRKESAYRFLLEIANLDLTETAFAFAGAVASGLMGLSPDAPHRTLETLPRLTQGWVRMSYIPICYNEIAVEHRGSTETVVTNQTGPDLDWKVSFAAAAPTRILIDGAPVPTTMERRPSGLVASATAPLPAGRRRTARL